MCGTMCETVKGLQAPKASLLAPLLAGTYWIASEINVESFIHAIGRIPTQSDCLMKHFKLWGKNDEEEE